MLCGATTDRPGREDSSTAYSFLKPDNLVEIFRTSQEFTEGLTDGFPEFERIARNKPHSSIPKEYPKTTDGTTASIIRKTPHRIIQQLPTGKVKSVTEDWLSVVAEFIYTNKIIPNANEGYALLQKCWSVVEKFLTFGFCPTYTPFVEHGGYFCTDLRIPYWGDIFLQPGKLSDADSNYVFMRSWWQTKDLDALIESQGKLDKKLRTWDIEALKAVKDFESTKDEKAKTPAEREKNINTKGGVELITGFQRGKGAKFYTFHVQTAGAGDKKSYTGTIVRTKVNKDPRGELPISFAYGDIDGSNPFGRSIIELVGPLQNMMDTMVQMFQYNQALMLNPPLIKRGNFSKNKIKFAPNIIIDVGNDPSANVEPLKIETESLRDFPSRYQLMQSQLLAILASPNSTISAEVGSITQSKTPQGVEQNKANLSIDDNYVRKQFETWFERWSETAINLYFAERTGIEELQLDQERADELRELAKERKFDPALLSDDNKIRIDYDSATPALKFEVDASTSKMQDEVKELQSLQGLNEFLKQDEAMSAMVPPQKKMELWNAIVDNSGTENRNKLKMNEKEQQEAIQKLSQPQDDTREYLNFSYKDAPEDIKRQIEQQYGLQPSQDVSPVEKQLQVQAIGAEQGKEKGGMTPEHVLKADSQAYQQEIDIAKLDLESRKLDIAEKAANKPQPKPVKKASK